MYRLILAPGVKEQIMGLSPFVRRKIDEAFSDLVNDPHSAFEAMRMRTGSFVRYRCKVGEYRIIYTINENQIEIYVLKVGHRRTVY